MSRESRLLVILMVIAAAGVSGLMVVANQYRRALVANSGQGSLEAEDATARAARLVDGFLAAREAAKAVVAKSPDKFQEATADATRAYRAARLGAFAEHRMTFEDYAAVRAAWRAFRVGKPMNDPALLAAFQTRRSALENAALGPIEAVDDAIR